MANIKYIFGLLMLTLLTACGGGGGSPGATSGSSGNAGSPTLTLSVIDPSGTESSNIGLGGGYRARAVLRLGGNPAAGRLVTFSLAGESTIATLTPSTALTDASGIAEVAIAPASIASIGAATLSAEATAGTATATAKFDFAVAPSNLSLSPITVGSSSLPSGGNTSISVVASLGGAPSSTPVNVVFAAACGRINGAAGSFSTTTDGLGVASAVYTAVNADGSLCSGPTTISATSPGAQPKTVVLTVAPPSANAIAFVSATPAQIFVAGSGALEQSVAKFKVTAGTTPLSNVSVVFSLQVNPGGVGLNASGSTANVTGSTDANGEVSVSVFSGSIPGPVKVRAALASNSAVFAESQNLSVSSGPPSQKFMSVSVQTFNIEGWAIDGTSTKITARLADRQGNPVEDGTVVNFTAQGGQIASSCATLKVNGISSCSVDLISQSPRPTGGRVSVVAFAQGTKDFVDVNGNNKFDAGIDTLVNIGDAYRDDNENGMFDTGEFVVPRGGTSLCTGSGAPYPARSNTCDSSLATTVRQQVEILFSSSIPVLSGERTTAGQPSGTPTAVATIASYEFFLGSADNPLLPMPQGTTVAITAADQTESNGISCSVDSTLATTVVNVSPGIVPTANLNTLHGAYLKGCASGDRLLIRIKSPSGLETVFNRIL